MAMGSQSHPRPFGRKEWFKHTRFLFGSDAGGSAIDRERGWTIVGPTITAYDTQRIKEMYDSMDDDGTMGRKAIMGALSLYLDFINLFLMLLRLVGDRR